MAIWMACSRVILVDLVADSLGRDSCMDERGVWAGVEAADEVWFLENLKKAIVVVIVRVLVAWDRAGCCCLLFLSLRMKKERKEEGSRSLLYL